MTAQRTVAIARPEPLAVLRQLQRGKADPSLQLARGWARWATNTPQGPTVVEFTSGSGGVTADAVGPGSDYLLDTLPEILGLTDQPEEFSELLREESAKVGTGVYQRGQEELIRLVSRLWQRGPLPVIRAGNVWDSCVAGVLEQKVTGKEAKIAWHELVRTRGTELNPGSGVIVPPTPSAVRQVPSWQWRRWGVDRKRSDTIIRLAKLPELYERCLRWEPAEARQRLQSIVGIGPWTAAEVAQRALGDPDAISVGDYHLAAHVVHAVTGRRDGTDAEMLELLTPFVGQRHRASALVMSRGPAKPRRGPRMSVPPLVRG